MSLTQHHTNPNNFHLKLMNGIKFQNRPTSAPNHTKPIPKVSKDEIDERDDGQKPNEPPMTGRMLMMHRILGASRFHHNG